MKGGKQLAAETGVVRSGTLFLWRTTPLRGRMGATILIIFQCRWYG